MMMNSLLILIVLFATTTGTFASSYPNKQSAPDGNSIVINDDEIPIDSPWFRTYYERLANIFYPPSSAPTTTINSSIIMHSCEQVCRTTIDCDAGLSCFYATSIDAGCCLKPLKPNEIGCRIDDQCKRACESTHCDQHQQPSRCLCDRGRHFLFNKCWKECPEFAHNTPIVDANGFSRCELKVDIETALQYMRRNKRQLRTARVFC